MREQSRNGRCGCSNSCDFDSFACVNHFKICKKFVDGGGGFIIVETISLQVVGDKHNYSWIADINYFLGLFKILH